MARRPLLITRAEYEARAGDNLAKDRWYRPEIRPLRLRGEPCLVKDYRHRPVLFRLTYGRAMVSRETTAYLALQGLPGIPGFRGRIDAYALIVERIAGLELGRFPPGGLPPGFLERLEEAVRAMHARGVVHGDLRQRRNILADPEGRPFLLDFASSVRLSKDFPFFDLIRMTDLSAIAKLRVRHAPETLTPADHRLLALDRLRPLRRARLRRRAMHKAARIG